MYIGRVTTVQAHPALVVNSRAFFPFFPCNHVAFHSLPILD